MAALQRTGMLEFFLAPGNKLNFLPVKI